MKIKSLYLTIFVFFFSGFGFLEAQNTFVISGGDASGVEGTTSYSVGQITNSSYNDANISVAEGVQQPTLIITGMNDNSEIQLSSNVYPNPISSEMHLVIENDSYQNLSFILYDLSGKILMNQKISKKETSINIATLISATYLIKTFDNKTVLKNYTIIKNNYG